MSRRRILLIYCLIFLFAAAPLICVMIACGVASAAGSHVDEGGVHPCIIGGVDYGEAVLNLFMCGWLMFLTIPAGFLAMLVFTGIWLFLRRRAKRNPVATL